MMKHLARRPSLLIIVSIAALTSTLNTRAQSNPDPALYPTPFVRGEPKIPLRHREDPVKLAVPRRWPITGQITTASQIWTRGIFQSIQVNVDAAGRNIVGDAANEPSIAVDPNNPTQMAIGWRQFDTILDRFRQSGIANSQDAGQTWSSPSPNVLRPNDFSSDPVLGAGPDGRFYYYALQPDRGPGDWACYMYHSDDGGITWPDEVYAWGGDKAWMTIDQTSGIGRGNIYIKWNLSFTCCSGSFTRSTDRGQTFMIPTAVPGNPRSGTLTVASDGNLFIVGAIGSGFSVVRSSNAQFENQLPTFDQIVTIDLGGPQVFSAPPNPAGLLGQVWIASDHSDGSNHGNLYVFGSVNPPGLDPLDVMFIRSTDGGLNWSSPIRINDDSSTGAWQWFGTMSVAPNGRIDTIWNDTRNDPTGQFSELFYSSSLDGGLSWSTNIPLSPSFNHSLGYPLQNKLGDYYDMVSDTVGVSIAYAATFNGEQDVYYLRVGDFDCNNNGIPDEQDIAEMLSADCNLNSIPDECDVDCNANGLVDECETRDGLTPDCDGNLVPDSCQPDFDNDSIPDACDDDIDNDGISNDLDLCDFTSAELVIAADGRPMGDLSGDCKIELNDHFQAFRRNCLSVGGPGIEHTTRCTSFMDFDFDSDIDLQDWAGFQRAFGKE